MITIMKTLVIFNSERIVISVMENQMRYVIQLQFIQKNEKKFSRVKGAIRHIVNVDLDDTNDADLDGNFSKR